MKPNSGVKTAGVSGTLSVDGGDFAEGVFEQLLVEEADVEAAGMRHRLQHRRRSAFYLRLEAQHRCVCCTNQTIPGAQAVGESATSVLFTFVGAFKETTFLNSIGRRKSYKVFSLPVDCSRSRVPGSDLWMRRTRICATRACAKLAARCQVPPVIRSKVGLILNHPTVPITEYYRHLRPSFTKSHKKYGACGDQ